MRTDTPQTIYLKDYTPYPYEIAHVDLNFDIHEGYTIVTAQTEYRAKAHEPLVLEGEELELMTIAIDGTPIDEDSYEIKDMRLTIPYPGKEAFTLEIKTRIKPEENTALDGLYKSGDTYCTQCEAEGFRRITYYPDRPDVMTKFTVRIEANASHYPVLLSNGNRIDHGTAEHGRHYAVWHDPFPKPCYLFALVAGNLTHIEDEFVTKSGRKVELYIYVRPGDEGQCTHAMESLKRSMVWEEEVYGLEYDLDLFNIVAVSDFNMGAMENKSLNIFNTALVLAHPDTATDQDYMRVERVIAHEYFHNWSGNRVTCRDWFQLSLKEGLTVFRDQEYMVDTYSSTVKRIDDVMRLRQFQFAEDAGPLAHTVRPDQYIEINNFYTVTVYEKGAEVIRMLRTIIGAENYRKGTDLYFERHDGQAVTCDDFIACMEDASGQDLSQFKLWYSQAGTPHVYFEGQYDDDARQYTVTLRQEIPDTPGQTDKKPMHIPVRLGLMNNSGADIRDEVLHLTEFEQSFTFDDIAAAPVPSVLRGFSAPVTLHQETDADMAAFLMKHDSDGFNRWEACKKLSVSVIKSGAYDSFIEAYGEMIADDTLDPALLARMMELPSVADIPYPDDVMIDPDEIYASRKKLAAVLKRHHKSRLQKIYKAHSDDGAFEISSEAMGRRALRNAALDVLTCTHGPGCRRLAKEHYDGANNMTDRMAAFGVLAAIDCEESGAVIEDFYERFRAYPLVVDKWFAVQASAIRPDFLNVVQKLRQHEEFNIKNPNRVRSLYAAFVVNNPVGFHAPDGSGYAFFTDGIIELNEINPQIAARLLGFMQDWRRYTPDRQKKMQVCLERILALPNLSKNVYEIASKSLKA